MGPIGFPETSIRNYPYLLRNNPEERSSHLLRGRSLKSGIKRIRFFIAASPYCCCNLEISNVHTGGKVATDWSNLDNCA